MLEEEHIGESRLCVKEARRPYEKQHGSGDDRELVVIFHLVHTSRGAFILFGVHH